jgi:hypothetical protein
VLTFCIFCYAEEATSEHGPHCSKWCKDSQAVADKGLGKLRNMSAPPADELAERRASKKHGGAWSTTVQDAPEFKVVHVHPNYGKDHLIDLRQGDCWCAPEHERIGDGLMVTHKTEAMLS